MSELRLASLASGGKDSLYAAWLCETHGWPVDLLLTLVPEDPDAMLFHTPNLDLVPLIAEAWGKPCRRVPVPGTGEGREEEALGRALAEVRDQGLRGITVGAIGSSYQWSRFWRAARRAGVEVFAPLWRSTTRAVVEEEVRAGLDVRIVQVASEALGETLLGGRLDAALLGKLDALGGSGRGFDVAGEGGDYETLVVDAPFFSSRLEAARSHVERRGGQARWVVDEARLRRKTFRG